MLSKLLQTFVTGERAGEESFPNVDHVSSSSMSTPSIRNLSDTLCVFWKMSCKGKIYVTSRKTDQEGGRKGMEKRHCLHSPRFSSDRKNEHREALKWLGRCLRGPGTKGQWQKLTERKNLRCALMQTLQRIGIPIMVDTAHPQSEM